MRSPRCRCRARQFLWRLPSPRSWSQLDSLCPFRKGKAGEPHARASYTVQKRSYVASCACASQDSLLQCPAVSVCSCLVGHGRWLGRERHRDQQTSRVALLQAAAPAQPALSLAAGCGIFRKVSSGPTVRRVQRCGWLQHARRNARWTRSPSRASRVALRGCRVLGGWLRQAQEGVFRAWRKGSLRQAQEGVCWALSPPSAASSVLLALESFGNSALGLLDRGVLGRLAAAS